MRQWLLRLFAPQALRLARPHTVPVVCPHCGMLLACIAHRLPVATSRTR
jgi:hypothetical protein